MSQADSDSLVRKVLREVRAVAAELVAVRADLAELNRRLDGQIRAQVEHEETSADARMAGSLALDRVESLYERFGALLSSGSSRPR